MSEQTAVATIIPEKPKDGWFQLLKELPVLIVVSLAIALVIKTFLLQLFFIPSGSMENTLMVGDRVLVSKAQYRVTEPKYKDIVVFRSPFGGGQIDDTQNDGFVSKLTEGLGLRSSERDFIKRVIATEGQKVEIKDGAVHVDERKLDEDYLRETRPLPSFGPITVGKDQIFVMGDNRFNSQDSRAFGAIPESSIVGRAFVLMWPLGRLEWFEN